ncbi:MAG: LicD family protein [Oscillospiraceae bacterium]|nr:LicD family protein [Oscillospiraceae bacterium]
MINETTTLRVQEVEHEIMQQIAAICRRHKLTFFAIGGTALGAVRHQGFIPWDDDIDIGMPRKDYEAFLRYAAQELPQAYYIQHFDTEEGSPFYFTKIRKHNTLFVEYYLKDLPIRQGIFVDIFPFDNVPSVAWKRKVHFRYCRTLYQLFLCKSLTTVCSSRFERADNFKGRLRKVIHVLLTPIPKKWLFRRLDRSVQMYNGKDAAEVSHIVRRRLRVKLEDLYPVCELPFGDYKMPVPKNYDAYLRAQFGEYDVLPPEDKRYGHLPYLVEFESQGDYV